MRRLSSGRDSFEPEMPRSTYSPKTSQPRRDASSRSSANCISGLCPWHVETLAYRATRMSIPPRVAGGRLIDTTEQRRESGKKARHTFADTDPNPSHSLRRARISEGEGHLLSAAPGLSTREAFDRGEILGLGCAVELDDEFDDEPRSTCCLIKRQRKLGESPLLIDRLTAMVLGGALSDRDRKS